MGKFDFLRRDITGLKNKKAKAEFTGVQDEVKLEDIPENLKKKLEEEFYKNFDFDRLFTPNEQPSVFSTFLPWINAVISLITLFLVFRK